MRVEGVRLTDGEARGTLMVLRAPLSFYGGVNPDSGVIVQADHPDRGRCIRGAILALERSTGSTVGAWTLLRMARADTAPAAILTQCADAVLITGTVTAGIPHIDGVAIPPSLDGCAAVIDANQGFVEIAAPEGFDFFDPKQVEESPGTEKLADPGSGAVIKLGGSLITVKDSPVPRINTSELKRLARLLAESVRFPAVLVHGAGSFGHGPVAQSGVLQRDLDAQTRRQWGRIAALQYQLDAMVADALLEVGMPVWPLQASALGRFDEAGVLQMNAKPLQDAISRGFMPLLYGTVAFLEGQNRPVILSGDDIAPAAALGLCFPRIVHLTDVPGVCGEDPKIHTGARTLPFVPASQADSPGTAGARCDVTGSMGGKLKKLRVAAQEGIITWIVDGRDENAVRRALSGFAAGTVVGPDELASFFVEKDNYSGDQV